MTRIAGPWRHRDVAANGARFHLAEMGSGPLVLFLHGFPEFWWAWRNQLPVVAAAGYRAVAMDLRGYGGSDKTPQGYDPLNLAADVAGLIRTLGSRSAVVVGQGWGAYVGWSTAAARPECVSALCSVSAPHPTELLRSPLRLASHAPLAHVAAMQVPWIPERRIRRGGYIASHLAAWAAPGSGFPPPVVVQRYTEALSAWPSPHCALEYHRWLFRSRVRADGRAFAQVMRRPIAVPVLQVVGAEDPAVGPAAVVRSARHVSARHEVVTIERAGHFAPEEQPDAFNAVLLQWLDDQSGRSDSAVTGVNLGS